MNLFRFGILLLCVSKSFGEDEVLVPGVYRIIGAEGEASMTTDPEQDNALSKVSMKYWNGTTVPAQEWIVSVSQGQNRVYSLLNSAVSNNVISRVEREGSLRFWNLNIIGRGSDVRQLEDADSGQCLTRLGVTVYDEGSPCDSQAQSQHWKFLFIRND